ncbi:FG-GAP-like repeat-containing protein [Streptomyces virginiae]|uniref:FG-GAP-like repeat-containing protein n=1 Tax=Streptomyces virginiae TaxID=1961 RepID=UPI0033AEBAE3
MSVVISTTLVGGVISAAPAAFAAPAPKAKSGIDSSAIGTPLAEETESAKKSAKKSGKPVEVVGGRTETDELYANPDGTMTLDRALFPVRVRQGSALVPVDPTLQVKAQGRIAPKAARTDVSFSGGGTGPLAVMRENGREIQLSWPGKLPAPKLSGDTAVYPEVLPGVDLAVKATADSFSHSLVVKSAEAAKNPALAKVDFGLKGKGLTVKAEPDGRLRAVDPTGRSVFSTPEPSMWDSSAGQPAGVSGPGQKAPEAKSAAEAPAEGKPAGAKSGAPAARSLAAPASDPATPPAAPAPRPLDDVLSGTTEGSRQADLGVELRGETLSLKTDAALLKAPETVFPVVIDPKWAPDAARNAWSLAYKNTGVSGSADMVFWNGGSTMKDFARVGVAKDNNGNTAWGNSYFRVGTGNLQDKQILDSVMRIKQVHAGSWSCNSGDVELFDIGRDLPNNITWNRQPASKGSVDRSGQSFGGRNCPNASDGLVEFDVLPAVSKAAANKWGTWSFGLRSVSNAVDTSWRKFDPNSARVSTRYNTAPAKPSDLKTNPSVPCTGGTFGLTSEVELRARVHDDEDTNLRAYFEWGKTGAAASGSQHVDVSSGGDAVVRINASGLDGSYWWKVATTDWTTNSATSDQCAFTIDRSRPSKLPSVSSAEFPPTGSGKPSKPARTNGTFVFGANGVDDVTGYVWWSDQDSTFRQVKATKKGGPSEPVTFKPYSAGPQYLYVRSVDAAGNQSDQYAYHFQPERTPGPDKPGDLNGDATVDLWAVDPSTGTLRTYPWQRDGATGGTLGAGVAAAQTSFAGSVIAHRGSWNVEDGYEDLIALSPSAEDPQKKELWLHKNDGSGRLRGESGRFEFDVYDAENRLWTNADQVLVVASTNDDNYDGVLNDADDPDLLIRRGGELYLFLGSRADRFLDTFQKPISLGQADWQNMTLSVPGDLNGDGLSELWARDRTTGKVHQYTSRKGTDEFGAVSADLTVYGDAAVRSASLGTIPAGTYPVPLSNGDFEGDGFADLHALSTDGLLYEFPGRAMQNGSAFGEPRLLVKIGTPWNECETVEGTHTGGKRSLCGPVLAKFKALGGLTFGHPTSDTVVAPDGKGRYIHLKNSAGAEDRSIYWSPDTGAWSIQGGIRNKWSEMQRESGVLGYPTSDEMVTPGGTGWVTTFGKNGAKSALYYSFATGGQPVRGGIYESFLRLGGVSVYGFPVDPEAPTSPKAGAHQHFKAVGASAVTTTFFWSSGTGAWPVSNANRTKYSAENSENGWLGFPTSAEYATNNASIRSDFEGGYIKWNRHSYTTTAHKPNDRTAHLRTDLGGDVNGDKRSDLITVQDYGNDTTGLYVLDAKPDGGLAEPREVWSSGARNFNAASAKWATGDFNGDKRADVAALYGYGDGHNAVFTWFGTPDGGFTTPGAPLQIPAGKWDWSKVALLAGDFNGDKRADVAVVHDHGSGVTAATTFTSKADGTFNAGLDSWRSASGWHNAAAQYQVVDSNGDGRSDIAAVYFNGTVETAMWTFKAKTDGGFEAPFKSWSATAQAFQSARIESTGGDYNGDGRGDLAIVYDYSGATGTHTFTAKPDGGFNAPLASWKSGDGNWWATSSGTPVSGDTDGDGRADIVMMYNYAAGDTRAFTLTSRADGGFDGVRASWYAAPGMW